ncbi:F-box protein [archaeon]|nr:MAG: F-box protein [archaeon]
MTIAKIKQHGMIGSALHDFFVYLDELLDNDIAEYDEYGNDAFGSKRKAAVKIDPQIVKNKLSDGLGELSTFDNCDYEQLFTYITKNSKALQWSCFSSNELSCIVSVIVDSLVKFEPMTSVLLSILITIVFSLQAASSILPNMFNARLSVLEQCVKAYGRVSPIPCSTVSITNKNEQKPEASSIPMVYLLQFINDVFVNEIKATAKVSFDLQAYRVMALYTLLPCHVSYMTQFLAHETYADLINKCTSTIYMSVLEMSIASYDIYIALTTVDLQQACLAYPNTYYASPYTPNSITSSSATPQSSYKKNKIPYRDEIKKKVVRSYVWKIDDEAAYYVRLAGSKRKKYTESGTLVSRSNNEREESREEYSSGDEDRGGKKLRGVDGKVRFWNAKVFEQFQHQSSCNDHNEDGGVSSVVDVYNTIVMQYGNQLPSMCVAHVCNIIENGKTTVATKECIVLHTLSHVRRIIGKHLSRPAEKESGNGRSDRDIFKRMQKYRVYVAFMLLVCRGHYSLVHCLLDALYSNIQASIGKVTNGDVLISRELVQLMFDLELYSLVLAYGNKLFVDNISIFAHVNQCCVLFMESADSIQTSNKEYELFSQALFTIIFHRVYDLCSHQDQHSQHSNDTHDCVANVKLLLEDYLDILLLALPPTNILLLYIYVLPILEVPLDLSLLDQVHSLKKNEFEGLGKGLGGSILRLDEDIYESVCPLLHPSLQILLTAWPAPSPSTFSQLPSRHFSITIPLPSSLSPCNLFSLYKQALLPLLSPLHHKGGVQIDRSTYNLSLLSLPPDAILNIVQYLPFKKVCRLSSVCSSLHNLLNVQYEERVWRHVYQTFLTRSVFADKISDIGECADDSATNKVCKVCLERRIAELEGYDSLREKHGEIAKGPVITKSGKIKGIRDVNEGCCMSVSTNHAWRLLLKERVQELRGVRKQQQQLKTIRSKAGFRACPVIGCHIVINSTSKHTMVSYSICNCIK